MKMRELIKQYLHSKELAWAASTIKSERARLTAVAEALTLNPSPVHLWEALVQRNMRPYARLTTWIRVSQFFQWGIDAGLIAGPNLFKKFKAENARLFKNAYVRYTPKCSYDEALRNLSTISDSEVKKDCLSLLQSGMRISESYQLKDGRVRGKGNKSRRVFSGQATTQSYRRIYAALKPLGLKPHDLRKLFASRLVEKGANQFELCELMGWSNLNTASSYIRVSEKKLETLVAGL